MKKNIALTELGMISETQPSRTNQTKAEAENTSATSGADNVIPLPASHDRSDENWDHFVRQDGLCFAGTHLVLDLWGASRLDDLEHIEATLREAVEVSGATLLHIHLHHFTPNGGVSGVAVLAESHISVHTWPERDYAAFDVFMCGDALPYKTIDVFKTAFGPTSVQVNDLKRGMMV